MTALITTTSGQVTWDSRWGPADEVDRLIRNWQQWMAVGRGTAFAVLSQDGSGSRGGVRGVRIDYCDIVSIEVDR